MKITAADKYFSQCVRAAHNHKCERCGKEGGRTELSHVFSRRYRTIRWDVLNGNCLCNYCHRIWHESPLEAHRWFIGKYGQNRMDILIEKRESKMKVSKFEEKEIAKHYREQLKYIENERNNGKTGYISFISYQ